MSTNVKRHVRLCTLYPMVALLLLLFLSPSVRGNPGNAEISRTRNLQCFEMTPSVHPPGNASVSRLRNLQVFEMTPQPPHPPGDVYISRIRNLQIFEMTPQPSHPPGDVYITRLRNLQCFEMAYQIHEIKANITHLSTTDQSGNQTINFMKGDTVQVNFTIYNSGVPFANALMSTIIQDPSSNVVFLTYAFEDFTVGATRNFILGYRIPQEAQAGAYTVKVMVFTDWPSEGGVGLDVKIATFNVS